MPVSAQVTIGRRHARPARVLLPYTALCQKLLQRPPAIAVGSKASDPEMEPTTATPVVCLGLEVDSGEAMALMEGLCNIRLWQGLCNKKRRGDRPPAALLFVSQQLF